MSVLPEFVFFGDFCRSGRWNDIESSDLRALFWEQLWAKALKAASPARGRYGASKAESDQAKVNGQSPVGPLVQYRALHHVVVQPRPGADDRTDQPTPHKPPRVTKSCDTVTIGLIFHPVLH
jgi:hypothetical protein